MQPETEYVLREAAQALRLPEGKLFVSDDGGQSFADMTFSSGEVMQAASYYIDLGEVSGWSSQAELVADYLNATEGSGYSGNTYRSDVNN